MEAKKMWEAHQQRKQNSIMRAFLEHCRLTVRSDIAGWDELYAWSIADQKKFWAVLARFVEIIWQKEGGEEILACKDGLMRNTKWFQGYTLNYCQNLIMNLNKNDIVIINIKEAQPHISLTGGELIRYVSNCAHTLKELGVRKGDKVCAVVPNGWEAIVAMLATSSLGAVFSSCSPDFGEDAIFDRFAQIGAKVLFYTKGYMYNGKFFDCVEKIQKILTRLPYSMQAIAISSGYALEQEVPAHLLFSKCIDGNFSDLSFEPCDFSDPLFILYSSGTTGVPKAIVHGVGGTLLQHKKELMLHCDLKRGQRMLFFTTCGWMMWNWMLSALSVGASLVLYDGSPSYKSIAVLWELLQDFGVHIFGTSPKFLASCMSANISPKNLNLANLHTILSTGSPLLGGQYHWVYKEVKNDLHLASISGGTDIISCFMLGNPLLPVFEGTIQAPGLGMAISARDEKGQEVVGKKGELVCAKPFVSMPICFLNDPDGAKYKKAYFEHPNLQELWCHGDYVQFDLGGITVFGRSDATLNPAGVRIGSAEIYRQIEQIEEILDSLVVGFKHGNDEHIILFVQLKNSKNLDANILKKIKEQIRVNLSPRHLPACIFSVGGIPYTISGKKVELIVKNIINGEPVKNRNALINPDILEDFACLVPQIKSVFSE